MTIIVIGKQEYRAEKIDDGSAAYRLTGKRGAVYDLWRNAKNPSLLFAVHAKGHGFGMVERLKGVRFEEIAGRIERVHFV